MNTQIRKLDSRNILTDVDSGFTVQDVVRLGDITKALQQQLREDIKQLKANYAEQNKLRPHVIRFRDLEREAKAKEARMQRTVALIGDEHFPNVKDYAKSGDDLSPAITLPVGDTALWEAIMTVLEQAPEMQVVELQHVLEQLGRRTSRQAIESAMATHKNVFAFEDAWTREVCFAEAITGKEHNAASTNNRRK